MTRRYGQAGCDVDGCEGRHKGLGYCKAHYERLRRNGDPLKGRSSPTVRDPSLPVGVLARLRAAVGLPPTGPSPEQVQAWVQQEREEVRVDPSKPGVTWENEARPQDGLGGTSRGLYPLTRSTEEGLMPHCTQSVPAGPADRRGTR